jgi:hypothetical protein
MTTTGSTPSKTLKAPSPRNTSKPKHYHSRNNNSRRMMKRRLVMTRAMMMVSMGEWLILERMKVKVKVCNNKKTKK